jgi:tetratricopeptide (TPR) repeat protein
MAQAAKKIEAQIVPLKEVILFISRPNIRPLLKQELKASGIETIFTVEDHDTCIEQMILNSSAMLIIDADHDAVVLNSILTAAQGSFNVDTRPILLITQDMSPSVISYATEYSISRVHTGEISRSAIQTHLQAIFEEEHDESGVRNTMIRIADARMRGDWEMSEFLLLDLYGRFPGNVRIACELAENYIHKNEWQQAKAITESISNPGESNLRIMHMKARCLMHSGAYGDAEEILQQCKLINPYNVDRLIDLGNVLLNLARFKDALESFEMALNIDPERKEALDGKIHCKLLTGDVNEALGLMRQVTSPRELASLFNNAAILSIRQGRFNNGIQLYMTAIGTIGKKETAASRLFYNLGIAYMKLGSPQQALPCFGKAAAIDNNFYNAMYNANAMAVKLGLEIQFPNLKKKKPVVQPKNEASFDFSDSIDEEGIFSS